MAEGAEESVLCQLLGIHLVVNLTDDDRKDTLRIAADHFGLSLIASLTDGFHDLLFRQSALFLYHSTCYTNSSGKYPAFP